VVDIQRLLGFDYGTKKIGVATANTLTNTSQALVTVSSVAGLPDWDRLDSLFEHWCPDTLVVGLPLHMDGNESPLGKACRKFAMALETRYNIPVILVDERLSSDQAELQLRRGQVRGVRRTTMRDAVAAELILHTYLHRP